MKTIREAKLYAKERNQLDDSTFGIPATRSYPLNDKAHVKAAIRMFNHVSPQQEKTLAINILKAMEKFGISKDMIGENNRLSRYI